MGIYRSGDCYRVELYVDSRRVATKSGFATKAEAQNWYNRNKIFYTDNPNSLRRIKLSFKELVDKYIKDYLVQNVKETTQRRYLIDTNRMLAYFGKANLADIAPKRIQDFQNELTSTKLSVSSINHCMTILFSIFEKGVLWDYCSVNPCKKVKRLKKVEKPYKWWKDRTDIIKFLVFIRNSHYFLFFKTALETGLRLGEIAGLTWDCIDLTTGRVELYRQYDSNRSRFTPLKNNRGRTVWIPNETLSLFRQLKATAKSEFVFTKPDGVTSVCSSSVSSKMFKILQKKAKVPIIHFHALRHTYASHYMLSKNANIYVLSKLLGHSSVEVTQKYAHLSEETLRESIDRKVVFDVENVSTIPVNHTIFTQFKEIKSSDIQFKVAI